MKITTIRWTIKILCLLVLAITAAMVWDNLGNTSDWFLPLASAGTVIVLVILTLALWPRRQVAILGRSQRDEEPDIVHYPRRNAQ